MASFAQALHLDGELAGQLIARAPRWLTGALVVLLGVRAATLVASLSGTPSAMPSASPPPPAATRNVVDVPSILRANLFGQGQPAPGSLNAPVTNMSLVLAGVIADADEKLGFAMLGTSATDIKVYRVGDVVPGGARLNSVLVDRVLLDRGGTLEAVLIPRVTAGSAAPLVSSPPQVTGSVARVQQVLRSNPALIGQVIQRQPVISPDGKLRGLRVYPGTNAQAFNRLGLRPGDLVTAINGTTLEDQTRGEEIFNSLSGAAEGRVTVIRNGSPLELHLNLAEVATEAERLNQGPGIDTGVPPGAPESAR
ncbi:MAG: type II secretion system protein GspC [Proteobacteria bacterium]|nr:type II secretion system protein GspC [Pseudomonadota bacterium]MBK9253022.1 type II secretion system protein GspC [Pseudomonadota bacterium]